MTPPARAAFQGERGAYSEEAALALFPDAEPMPCASLRDVFAAVTEGRAAWGVVPVENSQAGSINETYDLLLAHALHIVGEYDLRVRHCLLALPGRTLADLRAVYSHPQALAQCEEFLRAHRLEAIAAYDTAGSARMVAERRMEDAGVIAGRRAAGLYGLAILAEGIETNPHNYTKFLALGTAPAPRSAASKTSIVFTTRNVPGALHRALGAFAARAINLTKLESRPRREVPWEYVFYVDFEGHRDDPEVAAALRELEAVAAFVRVLGSYPRAPRPL
ncbi:MAG: prephenate dehydratase [Armatimonadota bacterium]|nr:prephenate dehydratase [Armatimonadota bacterium]MDR7452603.1 prephenate dehydratase [Armatimonadota bacterium]MDR7468236.1 prephenate dehydratase [Armatimonadota bacterium]MDR7495230.1 prephenate dehydratase [Armatimonadota bacterium]MDR7500477.1 prephenate dehydratase [Armatimonadota bacterium]